MYPLSKKYLSLFIILASLSMSHSMKFEPCVGKYIQDVLKEFARDPSSTIFDNIINPKLCGNEKQTFFLPKIFVWCPVTHYNVKLRCPEHNSVLEPGLWTDLVEKNSPRNPRLVYDLYGNTVLVQRFYSCRYGKHKYLSASPEILRNMPRLHSRGCLPIKLLFKSAFSKQLLDLVTTQVVQGVNFLQISEAIATLNFKDYCRRGERYLMSLCHNNIPSLPHNFQTDDFFTNSLFTYPSNDLLMRVFLEDFQEKKEVYESEMKKMSATILSFDHTFKVSKHIGTFRDGDSKFVGQFSNLFVGLNENKEIVTWKLTQSTKFDHIEDNIKELKERLCKAGSNVRAIFVDDCCKVRSKYRAVFGAQQEVKLDLFHAVQRITRTVPKGTELSKKFNNEFGLVFRGNCDLEKTRNMPTPQPAVIEENLRNFERRWADILVKPEYEKTRNEIDKIKVHVRKGCVSAINPGEGTAANENLHHFINRSLLCGSSTIGPELAIAILTTLFYTLNSKKKRYHHDRNARTQVYIPIEAVMENNLSTTSINVRNDRMEELNSGKQNSVEACEMNVKESPLLLVADSIEDFCHVEVAKNIINHAREVYKVLERINNTNYNRAFNVFHTPILQLKGLQNIICNARTDVLHVEETVARQVLARNLSGLGLAVDGVQGDGNCCFTSIIKQVSMLLSNLEEESNAKQNINVHLNTLGLSAESIDDDAHILRQLFVHHVQDSVGEYATMLGIDSHDLLMQTERFKISGVFNDDIGDIVVKVCSQILNLAVVVVTSMDAAPYIPFVPNRFCCDCPLYVAYSNDGIGHYDSTQPLIGASCNGATESFSEHTSPKRTRCTCGKNNKETGKTHCLRNETTRCPCANEGNYCSRECRCKCCQNKDKENAVEPPSIMITCSCGKTKTKTEPQYKACIDNERKSKCKCLKFRQKCTSACQCCNCHNGGRQSSNILKEKRKRKRDNPSPYKRLKGSKYLQTQLGQAPAQGTWTHMETFVLTDILSLLSTSSFSPSIEETTMLYNFITEYAIKHSHTAKDQEIRTKSVAAKLYVYRKSKRQTQLYDCKVKSKNFIEEGAWR